MHALKHVYFEPLFLSETKKIFRFKTLSSYTSLHVCNVDIFHFLSGRYTYLNAVLVLSTLSPSRTNSWVIPWSMVGTLLLLKSHLTLNPKTYYAINLLIISGPTIYAEKLIFITKINDSLARKGVTKIIQTPNLCVFKMLIDKCLIITTLCFFFNKYSCDYNLFNIVTS